MSAQVETGSDFHALAGDQATSFYEALPLPNGNFAVDGITAWIIAGAMLYVLARAIVEAVRARKGQIRGRGVSSARYALLALWVIVPIGAWTAFGQMPYPHRYIMAYPAQALAFGVFLSDALGFSGRRRPAWRGALGAAIAVWLTVLTVWNLTVYFGMLRFVDTHSINGGHGQPVAQLWMAASRARQMSGDERRPIVIHTRGDDPEYQGGAAEFDAVLGDLPIYLVRSPGLEVEPPRDFVWVKDVGNGQFAVDARAGRPTSAEAGLARMVNGVDLLAVSNSDLDSGQPSENQVELNLTWRVWSQPPSQNYGISVQLLDGAGEKVGQADTPFLRSAYWRIGDTITTRFSIMPSAGSPRAAEIIAAMYAYISEGQVAPVDILDIAGNPAGQYVSVPLLR
jgi:hypothetical protein